MKQKKQTEMLLRNHERTMKMLKFKTFRLVPIQRLLIRRRRHIIISFFFLYEYFHFFVIFDFYFIGFHKNVRLSFLLLVFSVSILFFFKKKPEAKMFCLWMGFLHFPFRVVNLLTNLLIRLSIYQSANKNIYRLFLLFLDLFWFSVCGWQELISVCTMKS